jgi:hypothetical protein
MRMRIGLGAALALMPLLAPAPALAQVTWDVTGVAGLFAGHTPLPDGPGYRDEWFQAFQAGVAAGRYLTRHLKLELEAAATTAGSQYRESRLEVPGASSPIIIGSEVSRSVRSLAAAVVWQFGDNDWVHPFVQAGMSVDFDRERVRTWDYPMVLDPRTPVSGRAQPRIEDRTTRHLRGVVGAGAKAYFSERGFVRADAKVAFDGTRQHLILRGGIGVDF